jgi:hypothetical protein
MEEVIADASIPVDRDADEKNDEPSGVVSNIRPEDFTQRRGFKAGGEG